MVSIWMDPMIRDHPSLATSRIEIKIIIEKSYVKEWKSQLVPAANRIVICWKKNGFYKGLAVPARFEEACV